MLVPSTRLCRTTCMRVWKSERDCRRCSIRTRYEAQIGTGSKGPADAYDLSMHSQPGFGHGVTGETWCTVRCGRPQAGEG